MPPPLHPLHAQLSNALLTRHNLPVSTAWLTEFLASRGPNALPPLPALTSTAHFRLLASDIRTSLSPTTPKNVFPEDVAGVDTKERRLEGTVIVQVLDVIDVGSSKWSQVEAIESVERGEEVRGREVIRTVAESILLRLLLMLRLLLRLLQQRRRPPRNSPPDHTDSSSKTRAERRSTPLNPSRSPRSPSPSPHRRPLPPPPLPLRVLIPHYRTNSSNSSKVCRRRRRKSTIPAC